MTKAPSSIRKRGLSDNLCFCKQPLQRQRRYDRGHDDEQDDGGEVALIVAQKGLGAGVVDPVYFTAVILLIVVSSIVTPLALKGLFAKA